MSEFFSEDPEFFNNIIYNDIFLYKTENIYKIIEKDSLPKVRLPPVIPAGKQDECVLCRENNFEIVQSNIMEAMRQLSISCVENETDDGESEFTYTCSSYECQELIHFVVSVFRLEHSNNYYMLFRQMCGDRFSFGEILHKIGCQMKLEIPGAKAPRVLDDEVDILRLKQITEFMEEMLAENSQQDLMIEGLQNLAACTRDISRSVDPVASTIFGPEGQWFGLVKRAIEITETCDGGKLNLFLTGISALADIFMVKSNNLITEEHLVPRASELSLRAFNYDGPRYYHIRREGLRLCMALHHGWRLTKEYVQDEFFNDVPAWNMLVKAQSINYLDDDEF